MKKPINMMFDEQKLRQLKMIARERSFKTSEDILYTDLIREAVDIVFFCEKGVQHGAVDKVDR